MRILIATTIVPFIEGGGTFIVDWLQETLKKRGYNCEVIKLPFHSNPPDILKQMLALRLIDLVDYADLLITFRTPSYIITHPNKIVWFLHHHRGAYDLWGTPYQDIPNTPEGMRIREAIIQLDNVCLREAKKIFAISKVSSDRLKKYNNIDANVLYPPLMDAEKYYCKDYADYFFYPSRISRPKRQNLAIECMKYTKSKVKLIVAGSPDVPDELNYLQSIIKNNNLESKVEIIGRWITQEEKIDLFANALGCIFIPYEEEYGYVSLEAYHSKKPIITCIDSGGPLEIVENGATGFIVPPEPKAIAAAMDKLFYDRDLAERMGTAGFEKLATMDISWDKVVQSLIE